MKKMTARDVMNPHLITIRADRTVQEAAVFLVEKAISGALVIDRNDIPVGVVSMTDIVEMRSDETLSFSDVPDYYSRSWEYQLSRTDMDELQRGSCRENVAACLPPENLTVFHVRKQP